MLARPPKKESQDLPPLGDRKNHEIAEEARSLILDSAAEGIFGCDPHGTCLFCNPAAIRMLGYSDSSELLGRNMHALEHHTRKDGTPFPIEECPIYRLSRKPWRPY